MLRVPPLRLPNEGGTKQGPSAPLSGTKGEEEEGKNKNNKKATHGNRTADQHRQQHGDQAPPNGDLRPYRGVGNGLYQAVAAAVPDVLYEGVASARYRLMVFNRAEKPTKSAGPRATPGTSSGSTPGST